MISGDKVKSLTCRVKTLLLMATAFLLSACTEKPAAIVKLSGQTMGTTWQVSLAHDVDAAAQQQLQAQIEAALEAVNAGMSTYRDDSELMRFNRSRDTGSQAVSPELRSVMAKALDISAQTDGAYDVTVGPLVNLWGFGAKRRQDKPDDAAVAQALALVGYTKLRLDGQGLAKQHADMFIDLSSIAKGYGVDQVAAAVQAGGYSDFLVEIGGEVRVSGSKNGKPWQIGIERPQIGSIGVVQDVVAMTDKLPAMATSGNYRNYIDHPGERVYHIIDPRTGKSRQSRLLSATVLAADCMTADAYATALMVLGDEQALAFADAHGLAAELIFAGADDKTFDIQQSRAFAAHIQEAQ